MAAANYLTPDIAERQVLVAYWDDVAELYWHHRFLLLLTSLPGVWLAVSPDWEVMRLDLNTFQVLPLVRNSRLPAGYAANCYVFDTPVDAAALLQAKAEATMLMDVLGLHPALAAGAAAPVAGAASWRIADTSSSSFGASVPLEVTLDPAQFVTTPAAGTEVYRRALVLIDGGWTFAASVEEPYLAAWRHAMISEAGLDDRVTGDERDEVSGKRAGTFRETMPYQREAKVPPFAIPGKRVVLELLQALQTNGMEWLSHHMDFVHKSGLSPFSGACRSHRRISEALQAMQQTDQLNLPSLAGTEILCRYLVQIETAVARNPKTPDFADLDAVTGSSVNSAGGLVLPEYAKYVADVQRDEAYTLKQRRLWAEETTSHAPRDARGSGSAPADGGRGRGGRGGGDGRKKGGRGNKSGKAAPAGAPAAPAGP